MRDDPDNGLNEQPRCERCRALYAVAGKGVFRHLVPDHRPWCPWHLAVERFTARKEKAA